MPSTQKPAKNAAINSIGCEVTPMKPSEPTTGTAITKRIVMTAKRCLSIHLHKLKAPTEPPTCSAELVSAAAVGGRCAAVTRSVGVQLARKK